MSDYPGALDTFTTKVDNVDDVMAAHVNDLQAAIVAIETELGTLPKGAASDVKTRLLKDLQIAATELTIASGAITVTQSAHKLQPESSTSDDLDTISGTAAGQRGTFVCSDPGTDTITFKHGTGNISCIGGSDIALSQGAVFWISNGTTVFLVGGGGGAASGEIPLPAEGRLSLTTGLPVTTADVTGATTLYYVPYVGSRIALYDGSAWALHIFAQRSIAIPASTDTNYDVFIYDNAGTITLELVAWTNATTRATALVYQDGVLVKSGTTTKRYLGTIRTTGVSGQCEDSKAKRFVWNYYNRVVRFLSVIDTTNSWSYTTAAFRQANASAANQVEAVIGVAEDMISMYVIATSFNSGAVGRGSGVGIDATNANSAQTIGGAEQAGGKANCEATYLGIPAAGYHYYAWLEYSEASGTTTWFGDNNTTYLQSGMTGFISG